MPASAYALVAIFASVSVASGGLAAWLVGPRRVRTSVLPSLAAFGALYLVGHRLGVSAGPSVPLLGFEVALPFDAAVGVVTALVVAAVQRPIAGRIGRSNRAASAG